MRLHRIELTGFGPFRERQSVDFDAFLGDGIFLISGRTGAGKSSILDGVVFALYGGVPRYDTGEKRLRSDYCEPGDATEVRLEFTVGDRRWRVTRAPEYERPAKRGGGMTTETARAELEEEVDGVWVGRAARPRDVALLLDEILGLNQSQFQQVILLAQNKFSRFLLAGNGERQALLRTLFDSRRFEQYRDALDARKREAQRELESAGSQVRTLLEVAERLIADDAAGDDPADAVDGAAEPVDPATLTLAARIDAAEQALQRAAYRAETRTQDRLAADRTHAEAAAEHARRTALAGARAELARARETLARLEAEAESVAADAARLAAAREADALRPALDAVARAETSATAAADLARDAEAAWDEARGDVDPETGLDTAEPATVAEQLAGLLAVWASALTQEQSLDDLARAVADEEKDAAAAGEKITELQRLGAEIPAELEALDARITGSALAAGAVAAARTAHDTLREQRAAAVEADALTERAHAADRAYAAATDAAAAASSAVSALLRRRLAGYAGELAAALAPGEECPVCGGVEHPHPAEPGSDAVTDEQFAAAEAAREHAAAAEREAAEAAAAARDLVAAARARAGGLGVAELDAALTAAAVELAAAEEAAREHDRLVRSRTELTAHRDLVAASLADLAAAQSAAREREVRAQERFTAAQNAVIEARGAYPTVAGRIAVGTRVRDAARAVVAARDEHVRAAATLADARARADEAVAASGFADDGQVRAALLPAAEQERLSERVTAHGGELTATRRRLLELELDLAGTEEDAADVEASRRALDAADEARAAAIAAEEAARGRAASLRDLLEQIDDAHAAVADLTAQAEAVTRLADTVAGRVPNTMKMDLETFVLAAELEEIVAAANIRLAEMSSGRYTLLHSDARAARGGASGLGIEVLDAHTGRARPPQSLSGGETFLASLALALGLAEVVTARAGGIRLDTLFIDEGFGSLDAETLELAMRTLDELRAGGRAVGVISHVEAMQEQLPAQVRVTASANGPSVIRQESSVPV